MNMKVALAAFFAILIMSNPSSSANPNSRPTSPQSFLQAEIDKALTRSFPDGQRIFSTRFELVVQCALNKHSVGLVLSYARRNDSNQVTRQIEDGSLRFKPTDPEYYASLALLN